MSTSTSTPVRATPVELPQRPSKSLSPSRAADFLNCPLRYRLRSIDQLPEPPSVAATRGTLVHSVLERLFDEPATVRNLSTAIELLAPAWRDLISDQPHLPALLFGGTLFGATECDSDAAWQLHLSGTPLPKPDEDAIEKFLDQCQTYLAKYFELENPANLEPAEREMSVSTELPSGLVLRGIVDRIDRAGNGAIRVVDYKTGRAPGPGWEASALFQMRFYGLILWRLHGRVPARLQLLYLGSNERLSIDPTDQQLTATEHKVQAIWDAIALATETNHWVARPSKMCAWCSFKPQCPQWPDTVPESPEPVA